MKKLQMREVLTNWTKFLATFLILSNKCENKKFPVKLPISLVTINIFQKYNKKKSLQWGLNSRPFAYEANALPLSYAGLLI